MFSKRWLNENTIIQTDIQRIKSVIDVWSSNGQQNSTKKKASQQLEEYISPGWKNSTQTKKKFDELVPVHRVKLNRNDSSKMKINLNSFIRVA